MHRTQLAGVTGLTSMVAILASSVLLAPTAATATATATRRPAGVTTVFVPAAARTGVATSVRVGRTGVLRIDATGAADASANPPYSQSTDPDGNPTPFVEGDEGIYCGEGGENHCLVDDANLGALVARIGRHGDWFLVGSHYAADPADRGRLYLAVNSDVPDPDGRTGGYTATIGHDRRS